MRKLLFSFVLLSIHILKAQATGAFMARVLDRDIQTPIPYSIVTFQGDTIFSLESDSSGYVFTDCIPAGSYTIMVSASAYKPYKTKIVVEASVIKKMSIYLEEDIHALAPVIIYSEQDNPYKSTSNFQFTAQDFAKSSTSFGDPSRLIQTLPGVVSTSDGSNNVSVRGSSPFNNNWYLEGIQIPNPNHFGGYGSTGGFISVFNENNLERFDFYLGGYPAMYGNSNSSVFDLKQRAGNYKKREYHVRVSPIGLYAGTEGYLKKKSKSSYIVNARLFDLYFFKKMDLVPTTEVSIPMFRDFSYKIFIPGANDRLEISLFGFGGNNTLIQRYSRYDELYTNRMLCNNLAFNYRFSSKTRLSSTFQASYVGNESSSRVYILDTTKLNETTYRNHTYLESKLSARLSYRVGSMLSLTYNKASYFTGRRYNMATNNFENTYHREEAHALLSEVYVNSSYKISEHSKLLMGVHALNISYNKRINIEPRLGISSKITKKYELGFSTGLYSKVPTPFNYEYSGYNLSTIKSLHLINSHTFHPDTSWYIKAEMYYSYLWNAYLSSDTLAPNASVLNNENILMRFRTNAAGRPSYGKNYGLDVLVRKKLRNQFEASAAGSLFRSQYLDGEEVWRNTAFDNKFNASGQLSKAQLKPKSYGHKSIVYSAKLLYYGGFYVIPIDVVRSRQVNNTVYNEDLLFTEKLPNYFRLDIGIQISYSRAKVKHEIRLDVQNLTNRKNVSRRYFDPVDLRIKSIYQLPLIPVVSYTAYF